MLDHFRGRRPVLFQHLLDQVDPAARAIEFVAEQHIGRTGRGAKSAMHAGAQDLVGFRDIGIGELRQAEFGFHAADPRVIRPRLRIFFGSKLWRTRSLRAGKAGRLRMKHLDIAPHLVGGAQQRGMTAGGIDALPHQHGLGVGPRRQCRPDQAAAPVVDHVAAGIPRQWLAERAAGGRRTDDPPYRPGPQRTIRPRTARTSRMELQIAADAASSRTSAAPNGARAAANPAARCTAEVVMPSSRSRVTACRCDPRSPSPRRTGPERRVRQMRRAGHIERRAQRQRHRPGWR